MIKSIVNFIKRLRARLCTLRIIVSDDNPLQTAGKESSVKECTRDKETVKRVAQAFKDQEQQIMARRSAHKFDCKDTIACTGCYELVPDEIVSKPYKVKRPMRRIKKYKDSNSGCT